jgi:ankyrin repeat protein
MSELGLIGSKHEILRAAAAGNCSQVAKLLEAGADANALLPEYNPDSGPYAATPLQAAVSYGQLECAQLLLESGADVNLPNTDRVTPLMAAMNNTAPPAMVRLLLGHGADLEVRHKSGATAFHLACAHGGADKAELLLRAGSDPAVAAHDGTTAAQMCRELRQAATLRRLQVLEGCEYVGAVVKIRGLVGAPQHNGKLAAVMHFVAQKGRYQLQLLADGKQLAVKPANVEVVTVPVGMQILVAGLANSAEHNGKRGTVQQRVGVNGRCRVRLDDGSTLGLKLANVELVTPQPAVAGGEIAARLDENQEPAAEFKSAAATPSVSRASTAANKERAQEEMAAAILAKVGVGENGVSAADIERAQDDMAAAMLVDVEAGDLRSIRRMLDAGAHPNTHLPVVIANGRLEATALLLDRGGDPNLPDTAGATMLMAAAGMGHPALVELLVRRGADLDATEPAKGLTALHIACWKNKPDCVEALVRAGCGMAAKAKNGRTAKQLAEDHGHTVVVERLKALVAERLPGGGGAQIGPDPAGSASNAYDGGGSGGGGGGHVRAVATTPPKNVLKMLRHIVRLAHQFIPGATIPPQELRAAKELTLNLIKYGDPGDRSVKIGLAVSEQHWPDSIGSHRNTRLAHMPWVPQLSKWGATEWAWMLALLTHQASDVLPPVQTKQMQGSKPGRGCHYKILAHYKLGPVDPVGFAAEYERVFRAIAALPRFANDPASVFHTYGVGGGIEFMSSIDDSNKDAARVFDTSWHWQRAGELLGVTLEDRSQAPGCTYAVGTDDLVLAPDGRWFESPRDYIQHRCSSGLSSVPDQEKNDICDMIIDLASAQWSGPDLATKRAFHSLSLEDYVRFHSRHSGIKQGERVVSAVFDISYN